MFCLSKFCYLCLTDSKVLESVEPRSRDMILLVRKLRACAIDIVHLKNYTLRICKTCSDILNVSYEFRRRCLGSNKKLLTYVKKLSNKTACYCEPYVILNKHIELKPETEVFDNYLSEESSIEFQDGDYTTSPSIDYEDGDYTTSPSIDYEIGSNFNTFESHNTIVNNQPIVKLERLNDNLIELYTNKSISGDNIIETVLPTENGRLHSIAKSVNNNNKKVQISSFEINDQETTNNNKNKVKIIVSEMHPLLKDLYIDRTLTCENNPNNVLETCLQIKQENTNISLKEKLLNELKIAEENNLDEHIDFNNDINLEEKNKNSNFEVDIIVNKEEPIELHIDEDPLFELPEDLDEDTSFNLQDHTYTYCPILVDNTCDVKLDHCYFNTKSPEQSNNKRKRISDYEDINKKQKEDYNLSDEEFDFINDGIVDFSW